MLSLADPEEFADALLADTPPAPADGQRIVEANRAGKVAAHA
jgi:hypothetical protein